MGVNIEFPKTLDSGRLTIARNHKHPVTELGALLCLDPKVYPRTHKRLPQTWTAEEIDEFTTALDAAMSHAGAMGDGYWVALLYVQRPEIDLRVLRLGVIRASDFHNQDEVIIERLAQPIPDGPGDVEILVNVVAGKEMAYRGLVQTIGKMLRTRFL